MEHRSNGWCDQLDKDRIGNPSNYLGRFLGNSDSRGRQYLAKTCKNEMKAKIHKPAKQDQSGSNNISEKNLMSHKLDDAEWLEARKKRFPKSESSHKLDIDKTNIDTSSKDTPENNPKDDEGISPKQVKNRSQALTMGRRPTLFEMLMKDSDPVTPD